MLSFAQRFILGPGGRALIVSLLLYLFAFQYCRVRYWRDPHSAFFDDTHVYDRHYSAYREKEATKFVEAANSPGNLSRTQSPTATPILCNAFITVKRGEEHYLDASIGSLLQGLAPEEREQLYLFIFFAQTDATVHPAWTQPWPAELADAVETYKVLDKQMERLKKYEKEEDFQRKGIFDYTYALERCFDTEAPYVAVFEDDIILADGWLTKTFSALEELQHRTRYANATTPWLYLRLFYTETAIMWRTTDYWYAHLPLAFLLTSSATLLFLLALRWALPATRPHLDTAALGILTLLAAPAFTALAFMAGRHALAPLSGVVPMDAHGCCTQALVYPRAAVPGLVDFLRARGAGQTDLLIEEHADAGGLARFAVAPPVLQHVGLRSSRGSARIVAQSTWAFYFEDSDPARLRREHREGLRRLAPWLARKGAWA